MGSGLGRRNGVRSCILHHTARDYEGAVGWTSFIQPNLRPLWSAQIIREEYVHTPPFLQLLYRMICA
jgi:hypothetical protein